MTPRDVTLPPAEQELKAALTDAVRAFGGQEAASAYTGYRQQRISDWCNPNVRDFAALDFIDRVEGSTVGQPGAPHVTRLLARRRGFALVELNPAPAGEDGLLVALARISAEVGDVNDAVLAGMEAAPALSAVQRAVAIEEVSQLIDRAVALRVTLAAGGGQK